MVVACRPHHVGLLVEKIHEFFYIDTEFILKIWRNLQEIFFSVITGLVLQIKLKSNCYDYQTLSPSLSHLKEENGIYKNYMSIIS